MKFVHRLLRLRCVVPGLVLAACAHASPDSSGATSIGNEPTSDGGAADTGDGGKSSDTGDGGKFSDTGDSGKAADAGDGGKAGDGGPTDAGADATNDGGGASDAGTVAKCGATRCGAGATCVAGSCEYACAGYAVPGDYATVQAAVSAVGASGGTVCIGAGTWAEDVYVTALAPLEIIGVSSEKTVVRRLTVEPIAPVQVMGLATAQKSTLAPVRNAASCTFTNVLLTGVGTDDALTMPGSWLDSADLHLVASKIVGGGRGLLITGSGTVVIDGCDISATDSNNGVAIGFTEHPPMTTYDGSLQMTVTIVNSYVHDSVYGIKVEGLTDCNPNLPLCNNGSVSWSARVVNDTFARNTTAIYATTSTIFLNAGWTQSFQMYNDLIVGNVTGIEAHPNVITVEHGNNALFGNTTNYVGMADGPGYVKSGIVLDGNTPPGLSATSTGRGAGDAAQAPSNDYWGAPRGSATDIGAVQSP